MSAAQIKQLRCDAIKQERRLEATRVELAQALRAAQQEGATIAQLMDWSGYSRRQVFNLLKS